MLHKRNILRVNCEEELALVRAHSGVHDLCLYFSKKKRETNL